MLRKCLTLLSRWWLWTVIGLRPLPVQVSDTSKKCLTLLRPLLVLTIVWCCCAQSWAAPAAKRTDDAEEKVRYGEVTGTISAVNKVGIAVEHARTRAGASEMYFPFSEHVKLERLHSLAELQPGATVKVRYEQVYKEGEKEGQQTILKTVATTVSLIRSAPTEGTLGSREAGTE